VNIVCTYLNYFIPHHSYHKTIKLSRAFIYLITSIIHSHNSINEIVFCEIIVIRIYMWFMLVLFVFKI